jgi:hypothetical protein
LTPATMAGSAGGGLRAAASHPDRRHRPVADRGATDVAGDDVVGAKGLGPP